MKLCPTCKISYPDDYQTCPRDQSALATPGAEIVPGTIVRGKYEVICELGAGGMATVYKAMHRAFHEIVALKVVHAQFMYDPDFVKRFRNEAIIVRQLKHPNAVHIEDFDYTEDGRPFIVMEFVDGRSLYEMRKAAPGPWPVDRCLDVVSQVAEALSAAHTIGIVHRDIKPANILLLRGANEEVVVKVLDFGIAKVATTSNFAGMMTSVQTQQNLVIGTPEYMSPEQASGLLETTVDGRSDLYSLGLVLYEMLTGVPPFQADTPMGMLMQQVNTLPAPPETVSANVPQAVSALVLKSLQKDPAKRFQNAAEMAEAMRDPVGWYAELEGKPVGLPPAPAHAVASPIAPPDLRPTPPEPLTAQSWSTPISAPPPVEPWPAPPIPPPVSPQPMPGQARPMPPPSAGGSKLPYILLGVFLFLIGLAGAGYWAANSFLHKAKKAITTAANTHTDPGPAPVLAETPQPTYIPAPATASLNTTPSPTKARPLPMPTANNMAAPAANNIPVKPKPGKSSVVVSEPPMMKATQAEKLYSEKNYAEAFPLADEACEGGVASGCFYVARMYEKGLGVAQNYPQAAVLYRRACDGGIATSCINLGFMYDRGNGVAQNYPLAATLYQKACDGGNAPACANLGIMYELGHGVKQSKPDALIYYRKGCDGANQPACDSVRRLGKSS